MSEHFSLKKADEALRLGLVNRVVPKAELLPAAYELAERLVKKNPTAVMVSKATVNARAAPPCCGRTYC